MGRGLLDCAVVKYRTRAQMTKSHNTPHPGEISVTIERPEGLKMCWGFQDSDFPVKVQRPHEPWGNSLGRELCQTYFRRGQLDGLEAS